MEINKLISPKQFGFKRNKNTEHNLLNVVNYISKAIYEGQFCTGIFLDLRQAFDVCNHEILFKKLGHKGIKGRALDWLKSYLGGRRQLVEVNGHKSSPESIDMSVVQGSILGPTLFLIYCTLMTCLLPLSQRPFCLLMTPRNLPEIIENVNSELKKWAQWFRSNKIAVNTTVPGLKIERWAE